MIETQIIHTLIPPTENLKRLVQQTFQTTLETYMNTNPTERPSIPRQKSSKKLALVVAYINEHILTKHANADMDFITLQNIIYCAAFTVASCCGCRIHTEPQNSRNHCPDRIPAWQRRLNNKISELRRDIGRLTQYQNGNNSRRINKYIEGIMEKYRIHTQHEETNTDVSKFLDTLKQKLTVASSRLKRYTTCTDRKKQNAVFLNNEKSFYRTIDKKHSSTTNNVALPTSETLSDFWSDIWTNPKQHNENCNIVAEDIDYHTQHILGMAYEYVPIDIFMKVVKNSHNWKSPGTDKIHNYWYKKFTTIHPFLHTHINKFIESPENFPKFITEGITYMLPKDSDYSNPAHYRPITCLQTIYKLIAGCIKELIYTHVISNNILAEEQKGCRKFSQGCKEQLVIDSAVMKQATVKKKDISTMFIDYRKAYDSVPHSWLLYILQHYKVHPTIIQFLRNVMNSWSTQLRLTLNGQTILHAYK